MKAFQTEAERYYAPDYVRMDLLMIASPMSDIDLYGICMPPVQEVFPHIAGYIPGFGKPPHMFTHWDHQTPRYDFNVYSLVRFFDLASKGNPNILELMYVPEECVIYTTVFGDHIRNIREIFLSKQIIPKFTGYYFSQKEKMFKSLYNDLLVADAKAGYNTKAAYHSMRLLLELEHLLDWGEMDLTSHTNLLQIIRDGKVDPADLEVMLGVQYEKVKAAQETTKLQESPNLDHIRGYMVNIMQDYYGRPLSWE